MKKENQTKKDFDSNLLKKMYHNKDLFSDINLTDESNNIETIITNINKINNSIILKLFKLKEASIEKIDQIINSLNNLEKLITEMN